MENKIKKLRKMILEISNLPYIKRTPYNKAEFEREKILKIYLIDIYHNLLDFYPAVSNLFTPEEWNKSFINVQKLRKKMDNDYKKKWKKLNSDNLNDIFGKEYVKAEKLKWKNN